MHSRSNLKNLTTNDSEYENVSDTSYRYSSSTENSLRNFSCESNYSQLNSTLFSAPSTSTPSTSTPSTSTPSTSTPSTSTPSTNRNISPILTDYSPSSSTKNSRKNKLENWLSNNIGRLTFSDNRNSSINNSIQFTDSNIPSMNIEAILPYKNYKKSNNYSNIPTCTTRQSADSNQFSSSSTDYTNKYEFHSLSTEPEFSNFNSEYSTTKSSCSSDQSIYPESSNCSTLHVPAINCKNPLHEDGSTVCINYNLKKNSSYYLHKNYVTTKKDAKSAKDCYERSRKQLYQVGFKKLQIEQELDMLKSTYLQSNTYDTESCNHMKKKLCKLEKELHNSEKEFRSMSQNSQLKNKNYTFCKRRKKQLFDSTLKKVTEEHSTIEY